MDLAMIVSPIGKLYMVENGKRVCSYIKKWESIYCFRPYVDELSDFINAEIDDYTNEIALYHHSNSTRKIIPSALWGSDEELQEYVSAYFGHRSTVESVQQTLDINMFGEPEIDVRPSIRISRRDFSLFTTHWQLKFSTFEANYIDDEDCFFSLEVFPTFDTVAFENICVMLGVEGDEQIGNDIWFDRMLAAELDIGLALSDNRKVFKASYGGVEVVVKRIEATSCAFKPACLKVWRTNDHQNIQGLKGARIQDGVCYLIFDYSGGTLEEHMLGWSNLVRMPNALIDVFSGIVAGLIYLHKLGICHMNLNPYNIMVNKRVPKLNGFTKAEKLTEHRKDEDLRALGKLIMFSLSPRDAPLKEKVYDDKIFNESAMYHWAVEARSIALRLQRLSVTLEEVLCHLWLWRTNKRIRFLCDAAQYLARQHCDTHMIKYKSRYFTQEGWTEMVPVNLMDHMRTWKPKDVSEDDRDSEPNVYNPWNPRHLLKFARNVLRHLEDIRLAVGPMECLVDDNAFINQLCLWFPQLMMGTYNYVQIRRQNTPEKDKAQIANLTIYYSN